MKKYLIIISLLISSIINGATYYVAPTGGSDSNPGTISQPWATWQKAFDTADDGDTVYFRGGTYYPAYNVNGWAITEIDPSIGRGNPGTLADPICYFNYPGETPILDCQYRNEVDQGHIGLQINNTVNIKFSGLEIKNVRTMNGINNVEGIEANDNQNLTFERMYIHHIGGDGMTVGNYDTLRIINCDISHTCDSLDPNRPGNDGHGTNFGSGGNPATDSLDMTIIYGSRFWMCADDGISLPSHSKFDCHDNWIWACGYMDGDGTGYKLAYSWNKNPNDRKIYNCITAYCRSGDGTYGGGFIETNLTSAEYGNVVAYYNNVSYKDFKGWAQGPNEFLCPGIYSMVLHRNNIVYQNTNGGQCSFKGCNYGVNPYVDVETSSYIYPTESWWSDPNPAFTITDDDFVSLDTAQLRYPRKADGSLPDITFMTLAPGSDLIDGGTDVGLDYLYAAPDLGWAEYDGEIDSTATDILTFILTEQTGDAVVNTTAHTVSIEVAHTADITDLTPTITLSYGATISPLSGTSQDFTFPVVYTVTALDEVTEQEWTITVTVAEVATGTDILTFALSDQTGAATINATNHTVAIEVDYTADITALAPTITLSSGATIIPASGVSRDFTSPLPYTVTAGDGVTQQEWTATVTQEAEPEEPPVAATGRIVKFNGKIVKR